MVYRKKSARRGLPRRGKTDSLDRLLRRAGLYSAAAIIVFTGARYYTHLRDRADHFDGPYQRVTVFEGKLRGDGLRDGLLESGADEEESRRVLKALRRIGGVGRLYKGDHFRITRSTSGEFYHLTVMRGRKITVLTPEGPAFRTSTIEAPTREILRTARGSLSGSLWLSMSREGVSAEIIQEFADVFQWTVDFLTEPRDGDAYAVSWTERTTPDGRVWGREIVAALYEGQRTGKQVGVLFEGDYFDEKGRSLESMFLRAPLNFRRISSHFSGGRWHPILRKRRPHYGIDYAAPRGTPVVSIGAGRVTAVGRRGGFGERIEVRHTSVYSTLYGHLNAYAKGIRSGAHVRQGQVIGYVGSTGLASGPHLHFQISKNGRWVDFLRLKFPKSRSVPGPKKKAYEAELQKRLRTLEGFAAGAT